MSLDDNSTKRFSRNTRFDVMNWLANGHRSITKSEQMSILSFLAYTAVDTDTPVEELQKAVLGNFNIGRIEHLKTDDYENAMRFIMMWRGEPVGEEAKAVNA